MPVLTERKIFEYILLFLFLTISVLFLAYFIIANKPGFILYTFPIFIVLGFFGSLSDRLSRYEIAGSLSFIIAGSLLYMGKSFIGYYALFSLGAFLGVSLLIKSTENKILAYSFFAMPDVIYFLGFLSNVNFAINSAIVGYYLLISAVISIFIAAVAENSKLYSNMAKKFALGLKSTGILLVAIIIITILIIAPIWPIGKSINLGILPHAQVKLSLSGAIALNNTTYSYPILLNESNYANYTDSNLSNIEFFYDNSTKVKAELHGTSNPKTYVADLYINKSRIDNISSLYLYFMPINYSNTTTYQGSPISNISTNTNSNITSVVYHGSYTQVNKTIPVAIRNSTTKSINTLFFPYYQLYSYCSPGYNITYNVSLSFSRNSSFFELYNSSGFIKGIGIANNSSYESYSKAFGKYSFESFYNVSHLNASFYSNKSCLFFVVNTPKQTRGKGEITSHYNTKIGLKKVTVKIPNLYMNLSKYITEKYSFVWSGAGYIYKKYENYSLNSSK